MLITTPPGGESAPRQAGGEGRPEMPAPGGGEQPEGREPGPPPPNRTLLVTMDEAPGRRGRQILGASIQTETLSYFLGSSSYPSLLERTLQKLILG